MKLNHSESSSRIRHLGKYFQEDAVALWQQRTIWSVATRLLSIALSYSILTMSLQAMWWFSDSSPCDSGLSARRQGHLACCLSQTLIAISSLSKPASPHLALVLLIAHLSTVASGTPLLLSTHSTPYHVFSFLCVPLSRLMTPLFSCSCFLSHHLWLLSLTYHPLHIQSPIPIDSRFKNVSQGAPGWFSR